MRTWRINQIRRLATIVGLRRESLFSQLALAMMPICIAWHRQHRQTENIVHTGDALGTGDGRGVHLRVYHSDELGKRKERLLPVRQAATMTRRTIARWPALPWIDSGPALRHDFHAAHWLGTAQEPRAPDDNPIKPNDARTGTSNCQGNFVLG